MLLGMEVECEEKPALVPSLFPFFSPTLYFSTANERGSLQLSTDTNMTDNWHVLYEIFFSLLIHSWAAAYWTEAIVEMEDELSHT